jgi:opacity protein-like surface antigen
MLKKTLVTAALLTLTSSLAFATAAPYVGAGLGITNNSGSGNYFRGTSGSLLAGYAQKDQNIYLAGEIFTNIFTASINDSYNVGSLKTSYSYGISFIPGVLLSDHTIAFARLGLVRTRFSSLSSTTNGGEIGAGLQANFAQNWDIRGEYDYINYSNTNRVSPRADQFNVGLIYKFE